MEFKDRQRLRELASHQLEIANSSKNLERVALWKRKSIAKGERPTVNIETRTFAGEVITPRLQCVDPFARKLEHELIDNVINLEEYDDDKVVPPYFQMRYDTHFHLFGHQIEQSVIKNADGTEMGHAFSHVIDDLEEDVDKIRSATDFGADKAGTMQKFEKTQDIFGDILPVRLVCDSLYAVPTQKVVHLMGMENMLYSIYDYPELFKEMMERTADSYIKYFKFLEAEGMLLQNHSFERLTQGSLCFYEEEEKAGAVRTEDVWGFMDSQETVSMSSEMFREFIFPCYKRIASVFGRLSYGCCEPVDMFWEDIKTLPNLKKVSISPWCNEDFMAEQLRGSGIVYLRKPSPNYLGVGAQLDEDAFRTHIEKTIKTARGCELEIAQRDVYTVNHDIGKVKRYVEIIKETIEKYW